MNAIDADDVNAPSTLVRRSGKYRLATGRAATAAISRP